MKPTALDTLRVVARIARLEDSACAAWLADPDHRRAGAEYLADQVLGAEDDDRMTTDLLDDRATRKQIVAAILEGFEDAERTLQ